MYQAEQCWERYPQRLDIKIEVSWVNAIQTTTFLLFEAGVLIIHTLFHRLAQNMYRPVFWQSVGAIFGKLVRSQHCFFLFYVVRPLKARCVLVGWDLCLNFLMSNVCFGRLCSFLHFRMETFSTFCLEFPLLFTFSTQAEKTAVFFSMFLLVSFLSRSSCFCFLSGSFIAAWFFFFPLALFGLRITLVLFEPAPTRNCISFVMAVSFVSRLTSVCSAH